MKVKVTQILKDYSGKKMIQKDAKGKEIKKLDLRTVMVIALNTPPVKTTQTPAGPRETQMPQSPEEESKIYYLSNKIWSGDEVDLTLDERVFIKKKVHKARIFGALIYGRVCDIFEDPKEEKESKKKVKKS